MNSTIKVIELSDLLVIAIPVVIVLVITWWWRLDYMRPVYGMGRMLLQLLLIGYVLVYIFAAKTPWVVMLALGVMLVAASWIALGSVVSKGARKGLVLKAFAAICLGGVSVLGLVTQGVLQLEPWYQPQYMIPLAGMIFSYGMNAISLAAERINAELERGCDYEKARNIAFQASMIPITNSLFAVGLVSLPGMMTGQILAGVSPFVAARYQILVMCMLFGATGIASAAFLWLSKQQFMSHLTLGNYHPR